MAETSSPQLPTDWAFSDRDTFTARWNRANVLNLLRPSSGFEEYKTITQRTAFYNWFDQIRETQGHAVLWPAAAMIVASQMQNLEDPTKTAVMTLRRAATGRMATSQALIDFGKNGNKKIFDDVFPKLSDLFKNGLSRKPLTGDEAAKWDGDTLRHEQFEVVQPVYLQAARIDPSLKTELKDLAEGNDIFWLGGVAIGGRLNFRGDILSAQDRFNHGMNVVVPFYKQFKMAIDEGRKRRQLAKPDPQAGGMVAAGG